MRTRTLVVAGAGAAAVAYLFDPHQGRSRRDRIRATIQPLTRGRAILVEPPSPLPQDRAPDPQAAQPDPLQDFRPIPEARSEPFRQPLSETAPNAAVDAETVRIVRTKLEERSDLRTDELVVDVVNGVAYLSGDLRDRQTFGEVVDLTAQVPGVRRVQSLLHLPNSETISSAISDRRADKDR